MLLAFYDGVYLHLWKFELFNHSESLFEHKIHTIRAILFPITAWLLFACSLKICFIIAVMLILLDLIVLATDAYVEEESRSFMGGLPRWEYIIHLFANSLHFSSFLLIIATRIRLDGKTINYSTDFIGTQSFLMVENMAHLLLPGAFIIGFLHLWLSFNFGKRQWMFLRSQITSS